MANYRWYAFILYPSEDIGHGKVLQYLISQRTLFDTVYIEHEPEPLTPEEIEEGHNERKRHTHVLVRTKKAMTEGGFLKFFRPYLNHVEPVSSYYSYLVYMIHGTLDSENKIQYPVSALQGSQDIIRSVFGDVENLNFIQLAEFADKASHGRTLAMIIKDIASIENAEERKQKIKAFHENEYLVTALTQEYRSLQNLIYKDKEYKFQLERAFYKHES